MNGKRFAVRLISVLIILSLFLLSSCSKNGEKSTSDYLGDYSYDSSISVMVYEQVEVEEDGYYGIQYRKVEDLEGLLSDSDEAVCLYFYDSYATSTLGITAGVEDLAQTLVGRVTFVAIDAGTEAELSSTYSVEAYPEFILIKGNERISTFDGYSYQSWTMDDVASWINSNGYAPDYSMLNG